MGKITVEVKRNTFGTMTHPSTPYITTSYFVLQKYYFFFCVLVILYRNTSFIHSFIHSFKKTTTLVFSTPVATTLGSYWKKFRHSGLFENKSYLPVKNVGKLDFTSSFIEQVYTLANLLR